MEIKDRDQSYRSLLGKLMEVQPQPLIEAYGAIEGLMEQAECYVNVRYIYVVTTIKFMHCRNGSSIRACGI